MFSYFKNRKTTYFDVFCLNFSIETKIKTIFQISYFNLSKNPEIVLLAHGFECPLDNNCLTPRVIYQVDVLTNLNDSKKFYIGLADT